MNSPVKILTKGGRGVGETRLFLECDQKRDQAKSKDWEIFSDNFVLSRNQETSVWIPTRATPLVALKMVILRQNET